MALKKDLNWVRIYLSVGLLSAACVVSGCNTAPQPPNDQQIQQQAAKTTEQVKQGARVAAADAKVAAANAERKLDDIAAGVRQGMNDGSTGHNPGGPAAPAKPSNGRIDLNSASADELATLPGVSASKARDIINARPFGSSHDLVTKGLLSESHYEHIAHKVTAR